MKTNFMIKKGIKLTLSDEFELVYLNANLKNKKKKAYLTPCSEQALIEVASSLWK